MEREKNFFHYIAFAALALSAGSCGESVSNGAESPYAKQCRQHLNAFIACAEEAKSAFMAGADSAALPAKLTSCDQHFNNIKPLFDSLTEEQKSQKREELDSKDAGACAGGLTGAVGDSEIASSINKCISAFREHGDILCAQP